jgi:hypothetical protein
MGITPFRGRRGSRCHTHTLGQPFVTTGPAAGTGAVQIVVNVVVSAALQANPISLVVGKVTPAFGAGFETIEFQSGPLFIVGLLDSVGCVVQP